MQRILITGADGFIGSHLSEILLKKDSSVRALSQYNSFNSWGWLDTIPKNDNLEVVCGDIRDPHFCKEITKGIDIIFHLAALIAIPYSYIAPESYVDTNVKGTLNICQAAKDNSCQRLIHTSTSEVYGTAVYVPIDEKHPLQPQSPYSASKIGADQIALSFHLAFGLPVTIARPFNTYGPRQSARAVIPTIITQIAKGEKQIVLGDLSPTRDFNYVTDTCHGFIALADSQKTIGEVVNIGSGTETSVRDTLNLIKKTDEFRCRIYNR
jgi:NAD dependent epimerase/dehydratase